jgi:serine/threonine protein phosphatase PrpC
MISGLDVSLRTPHLRFLEHSETSLFHVAIIWSFVFLFHVNRKRTTFFLCSQGLVDALSTAFLRSYDKDDMVDKRGNDSRW